MPDIYLPTLHAGQVDIYKNRTRLNAVRCGRRWGKTKQMVTMGGDAAAKGRKVGLFTPEHKQLLEPYDELLDILQPIKRRASKNEGTIRTKTGGIVDFWQLDDNELAGRGREYDLVMIDEAAFTKNGQMMKIWEKSIKPTLLTRRGSVWVFSTPNGVDSENFFYRVCNDEKLGFAQFHAPTSSNPYVPPDELEKERLNNHPLVWQQEFEAKFVDWSGVAFFEYDKLTVDGKGVPYPEHCDGVFAIIDSAMKDGSGNDGTAVVYCALSKHVGHPLIILDWDIVQINSDLLVTWLPNVFTQLEHYAKLTKARAGSLGAFIEDKSSGITLNQHSSRVGWPAQPINGDITSIGKDGRAVACSGSVYRGEVKFSAHALDKVVEYKGQTKNHLVSQVVGYRIGDKDAHKRADDLADGFMYGVIIGLGGPDGF
ncbi:FIG01048479: hypothetical protein [Caballeronia glathei]|uniref:Terminase n=1 Tax=Caballeronia glathei TaxID=60547 RepID=A0A069PW20_9BURK|nr:hypothetical protein [Caballeronia glathei]KDR41551.1 terminase [Caballeronia glathei]CDY79467.1 FIG01048479: hypothetical protein [Caballeronia glathei]